MPFLTGLPFTDVWDGLAAKLKFGPAYSYRFRNYRLLPMASSTERDFPHPGR